MHFRNKLEICLHNGCKTIITINSCIRIERHKTPDQRLSQLFPRVVFYSTFTINHASVKTTVSHQNV